MMATRKKPEDLRSHRWFGVDDLRAFGHRSRMRQIGYDAEDWRGKPVIGIINTWSDINPCHAHFPERVQWIKRGVLQAGGFPLELPALSLSEPFVKPTTMLYRNLLAMECEELIRSHPIDGVVLLGGCDKTTPALIMGATSADLPAIYVPAGPMLRGNWRGQSLGSGSAPWKYWDERRAGKITEADWTEIENGIARSPGHCMTMGTASTMTAVADSLGLTLPGASSIPASRRRPRPHGRAFWAARRRDGLGGPQAVADPDPGSVRERHDRADGDRRLDELHRPCARNGAAGQRAALARRPRRDLAPGVGDRQYPPLGQEIPDGGFLFRRRLARRAQAPDAPPQCRRADGVRRNHGRDRRGRPGLRRRRHPAAERPDLCRGRDRDPARQPRPERLRHETRRLRAALPQAHRPGDRFRELRRDEEGDRPRRSRRHPGPRHRPEERRPARRARHARMGHAADPEEAREGGRARHAAHLRRPHERHELRRLHPACRAGGLCRRPAGARSHRRHDHRRRAGALDPARGLGRGARPTPCCLDAAAAALRARLRLAPGPAHPPGRRRLRLRFPRDELRQGGGGAGDLLITSRTETSAKLARTESTPARAPRRTPASE